MQDAIWQRRGWPNAYFKKASVRFWIRYIPE